MSATNSKVKSKKLLLVILIATSSFYIPNLKGQSDDPASHLKVTADLVSLYIWRGSLATISPTPNFQPTLSFTKGNFEIGVWGSTDFTGSYKELDLYVFLTTEHIKFGVTDYNWDFSQANYFNYKNSETGHRLEGTVGFTGTENFPMSVTWNTLFYGLDKDPDDSTRQVYSTYVEVNYSNGPVSVFLGFTPWLGYYNNYGLTSFDPDAPGKTFSIVNIGASVTKSLEISDTFSLPLKATLVINPSATYSRNDYINLMFGITF
jgi:hypothetical protein